MYRIIELNPQLKSMENIRAASYLGYEADTQLCVDELIEDIEYSSHGVVEVNIVGKEYLEENNPNSYKIDCILSTL